MQRLEAEQLRSLGVNGALNGHVVVESDGDPNPGYTYRLVKDNRAATVDPTVSNDNTQGYSPGSIWVNITGGRVFFNAGAATGAAVWVQSAGATPGATGDPRTDAASNVIQGVVPYLGSFAGWNNTGNIKKNDYFFGRIWLLPDTYKGVEYVMTELKASTMEFAIYADNGGTPPRPTGAQLAFGSAVTPGTITKHRVLFGSPWVNSTATHYWVGWKSRTNDHAVSITSHQYDHAWGDIIYCFQTGVGDITLPNPIAGPFDANADTPLPFFAVVTNAAP